MDDKIDLRENVIVMVDDDRCDGELVRAALRSQGYALRLESFSSAEEALKYLNMCTGDPNGHPLPKLILLDLNMPGMGGKEFLKIVKDDTHLCTVPVIVISASGYDEDIRTCYERQAAGYIQKNLLPGRFNEIFNKLVRYWFETSETHSLCP